MPQMYIFERSAVEIPSWGIREKFLSRIILTLLPKLKMLAYNQYADINLLNMVKILQYFLWYDISKSEVMWLLL